MKKNVFLLLLITVHSCSTSSQQKNQGKLIVDSKLTNSFFGKAHIAVQGGSSKVYIDSVEIYSNDSMVQKGILINADIKDFNSTHYPFRTCLGVFNDTLFIEFSSGDSFNKNKLKINIIKDKYFAYYFDANLNKNYIATPLSLKVREKITKKTEAIYGVIEIDFFDPLTNNKYLFRGPFVCYLGDSFLESDFE